MNGTRLSAASASALALALALASCGSSKPSGQVVAKVGKQEITALDLQTELGNYKAPNPQARKAAEQAALQSIIQRKVLAQAAHDQKIDGTPEYARIRSRQDDLLLVRMWEDKLARAVPAPNADEVQQYVDAHPDSFAQRKIFAFDALRFPVTSDATLQAQLQPLHTLDEVKALLDSRKIPYQMGSGDLDAFTADPRVVDQMAKLPPTDVFAMRNGGVWTVGKVKDVKVIPVTGQPAIAHATEVLRAQRMQEAVGRNFGAAVAQAQKSVSYNEAYEPSKPAAALKQPVSAKAQ